MPYSGTVQAEGCTVVTPPRSCILQLYTLPATHVGRHGQQSIHASVSAADLLVLAAVPALRFPRYTDAGLYLMDLKAAGKVKHISVTNMDTARLIRLQDAGVEVATNQVGWGGQSCCWGATGVDVMTGTCHAER